MHHTPITTLFGAMALCSCTPEPTPWYSQLEPDSPCYRVNLVDGLDEGSTAEVQDLFGCVNHHGHVAALEPTAAALETDTPIGEAAGITVARMANALPEVDVELLDMISGSLALVEDEALSVAMQDIALEALYGTNRTYVRREGFALDDPTALDAGLLPPLRPALPELAAALQADDGQAFELLADVLEEPETHRWIWSVEGWVLADDPRVSGPVEGLVPHLGGAIVASASPGNDRWRGASGHSLRDLTDALTGGDRDVVQQISPELRRILADPTVRAALPDLLVRLQQQGHLQVTPAQATWMAEVDTRGGVLTPGEDSALVALLRLLHATNQPLQCRMDIWVTVIDVDLGNLAVTLLRVLADQDPDDVQDVAGLLGRVLGYGVGEGVLKNVAESGTCPALTAQVVDDLYAMERLGEPQSRGLTHTLIGLVKVLRDGEQDRIQELVDIVGDVHQAGAVPALEETLRDIGEGEIGEDLVNLVAVMDDPARFGIDARGKPATTLEDLLELLVWTVEPGDGGATGWQRLKPLIRPALEQDGTWTMLDRAGALMADERSALSDATELVPLVVNADPELTVLTGLAPALRARPVVDPALDLMQTESLLDEILTTAPAEGQDEVPLAFAGRLIARGTLDDLLRLVRTVIRELDDA